MTEGWGAALCLELVAATRNTLTLTWGPHAHKAAHGRITSTASQDSSLTPRPAPQRRPGHHPLQLHPQCLRGTVCGVSRQRLVSTEYKPQSKSLTQRMIGEG